MNLKSEKKLKNKNYSTIFNQISIFLHVVISPQISEHSGAISFSKKKKCKKKTKIDENS